MTTTSGETAPELEPNSGPAAEERYFFAGRWYKYNYPAVLDRLGKMPDTVLARELGCSVSVIARLRRELGIPTYSLTRQLKPLLGKYPDLHLARIFHCNPSAVSRMRRRFGIPKADVKAANAQRKLRAWLDQAND